MLVLGVLSDQLEILFWHRWTQQNTTTASEQFVFIVSPRWPTSRFRRRLRTSSSRFRAPRERQCSGGPCAPSPSVNWYVEAWTRSQRLKPGLWDNVDLVQNFCRIWVLQHGRIQDLVWDLDQDTMFTDSNPTFGDSSVQTADYVWRSEWKWRAVLCLVLVVWTCVLLSRLKLMTCLFWAEAELRRFLCLLQVLRNMASLLSVELRFATLFMAIIWFCMAFRWASWVMGGPEQVQIVVCVHALRSCRSWYLLCFLSYYGLSVWFPDMIKHLQYEEYESKVKVRRTSEHLEKKNIRTNLVCVWDQNCFYAS